MSSFKPTKVTKCRVCHKKAEHCRPAYLDFGITKKICDDCFKTFEAKQVKYTKEAGIVRVPCCKRCKQENMGFGYYFKKKMYCMDCMSYDGQWTAIYNGWWPTCIDSIHNYINETPIEN